MGKKIPFWQCILVMLVMVATLYWSIVKDAGEKPHIALMISALFAFIRRLHCLFQWMEMGIFGARNDRSNPKIYAGLSDSCCIGCDHRVLDGSRYNPNHDVLWD